MNGIAVDRLWQASDLKRSESVALTVSFAVLFVLLLVTAANALFGIGGSQATEFVSNWVSSVVYIVVAMIVALRAIRGRSRRIPWGLLAVGLALYALGNVLWSFWIGNLANPPIPSICDALWLTLYPLSYLGILGIARADGQRRVPAGVWLDGIIAGGGLAAIGAALVFEPVLASISGSTTAVATELAYPIGDLLLAALVVGVLALRGWRLDRTWGLLGGGFLLLSLADCLYAVQVANGSSDPSRLTNFFYVFAVALLAAAAWQFEPPPPRPRLEAWAVLLVPASSALASLGLLLYDHVHRLDQLAFSLAVLTLLASILRTAFAFADLRSLLRERVAAERERRQLQERLQRAQRLESVGALAGGVAHDFNNLLAIILNYVGFVREELPPGSQGRSDVDEIGRAAERGARLTAQLLAFGQRKVGEMQIVDVREVIAAMHTMLDRPLGKHIELRVEPVTDLWPVRADPTEIEQIILNLVVNARDALMARGGLITGAVQNVELPAETAAELDVPPGRYVRLAVTDDGCGIDPETLEHVLEPYFTTKSPGQGSGLGLATVYGIARQAGGAVAITSKPGSGTTVEVYLPAAATQPPTAAPARPPASSRADAGRILLVEAEAVTRDAVRGILEHAGYDVCDAERGDQALELLARDTRGYDLLLTAVIMPGIWGDELASRAQELHPDLLTLYMSGHGERFLRGGRTSTPSPTLTKPFGEDELLLHVARLLRSRECSGAQPRGTSADNLDEDANDPIAAFARGGDSQRSDP
ncbi:MAG: ATP-binding protein [Solirubrobacteraceae bacterium]